MGDIRRRMQSLGLSPEASIHGLLSAAQEARTRAEAYAEHNELHTALDQYLRAYEIAVNVLPLHPRFDSMREVSWFRHDFAALRQQLDSMYSTMMNVKATLNSRNASPGSPGPIPSSPRRNGSLEPPLRMPSPRSFSPSSPPSSSRTIANGTYNGGAIHRKPVTDEVDALSRRFAGLRTSTQQNGIHNRAQSASATYIAYNPAYDGGLASQQSNRASLQYPSSRPQGPRDMNRAPPPPDRPPAVPPKVPLKSDLPQSPARTYDPTYAPVNPTYHPPRASLNSTIRQPPFQSRTNSPFRPYAPNGSPSAGSPVPVPSKIPFSQAITPQALIEYMKRYEILIIDVRMRPDFDRGHIDHKHIICIEPLSLLENASADDLLDRLVISPESECDLFRGRNDFDLVVYYDQCTTHTSFLSGSPADSAQPRLRSLYDTLYEFNGYRPLRDGRPPALLIGGLAAWIDAGGSLATSNTLGGPQSHPKSHTYCNLKRNPSLTANSIEAVRQRRLSGFASLSREESRLWSAKIEKEHVDFVPEIGAVSDEPEPTQQPHVVHTVDEFMRKYPAAPSPPESMMAPQRYAPNGSSIFVPPSRPAPAAPRPSYGGVSEGRPVQPPLARQNSATKVAFVSPSSPLDRLSIPKTGLVNLGNTCYMNSIIQCLSGTLPVAKFFIDDNFRSHVQKNPRGTNGVFPLLFSNVIRMLWRNDRDNRAVYTFRSFCQRINRDWAGSGQQDAKEFFDVIVDFLHEDLNLNWHRNRLAPLSPQEEARREKMDMRRVSDIEWAIYTHRDSSCMSYLFAGQHASQLRCTLCNHTSTTWEAFYSISIEIPKSGIGNIYDCLASYCREELLQGTEWKCSRCQRITEPTKRIILTRAPQILVFHFKRFHASSRQTHKIHTPIHFPLTGLDLTPFMLRKSTATASSRSPSPNPSSQSPSPSPTSGHGANTLATTPPYMYNAYGVVRHVGPSSTSGHYVALVRDRRSGVWRRFDDTQVSDFRPSTTNARDHVQSEQAYLVFYERCAS